MLVFLASSLVTYDKSCQDFPYTCNMAKISFRYTGINEAYWKVHLCYKQENEV